MTTAKRQLFSRVTSHEVIEGLLACRQAGDTFYHFDVDSLEEAAGFVPAMSLRIKFNPAGARTTLADGSEIAHCVTDDGREVSLLLGHPGERDMQPAQVIVGGYE